MTESGSEFRPVRLGVVGLGRFARLHALTATRLVEAELVAVVARRQANAHHKPERQMLVASLR